MSFSMLSFQQPLYQIQRANAVVVVVQSWFEGENEFFVVIADLLQRREFALAGGVALHGFGDLDIAFFGGFGGDEINFLVAEFADGDVVTAAQEFEVDDVFDGVTAVAVAEAEEIVAQADVDDVILSEGAEKFFAFDVEAFDLVEKIAFEQRVHIGLYGVGTWGAFARNVFEQALIDERVADGGEGDGAADIIGEEKDNFAQQDGIGELTLATTFFALEDVAYDDGGIDAVEERQGFVLVQAYIGDARHATVAHVGVEGFA